MAVVIDASGAVMGRLASHVAKRLLEGESIVIVNAERCMVSGSRDNILEEYRHRRTRGTPRFGPYYPRVPHQILKRSVRGMMPYQTPRGREAFRRLRVELGVPEKYKHMTLTKPEGALRPVQGLSLAEVSAGLGYELHGARKPAPQRAPVKEQVKVSSKKGK
jgi:large subunit ribosomal protein L13